MSATVVEPVFDDRLTTPWSTLNQKWLAARIAAWRAQLERRPGAAASPPIPLDEGAPEFTPALLHLRRLFGLSAFEADLLVVAAGVELDAGFRRAVAGALALAPHDPVRITFALALSLLPEPHWDAASPLRPLRYWSLVHFDISHSLGHAPLRVDERVLHYLTGVAAVDERLKGVARFDEPGTAGVDDTVAARMAREIETGQGPVLMLSNATADPARLRAARALAHAALDRAALRMLWVDASAIGADARDLAETAGCLDREAALSSAGIVVQVEPDAAHGAQVFRLVDALRSPVILLGTLGARHTALLPHRAIRRFAVPAPPRVHPPEARPGVAAAARRALQQFQVEPGMLEQALAATAADGDERTAADRLWDALRESARGGLDALAHRIDSSVTFDDLIVPPAVTAQLRELSTQLRYRHRVHEEWGFGARNRRGLGLAALFAGESGTGKTMAAEAIANAARLDLYRIDLASVVNKYIGETEKNLARLFEAAERSGAVLFFDEADALFGKRSEVKDSHDRYANIEVAYLLQRIESYQGLAILATNMKTALDRAFLRRIRFIVQFPFPDEAARERIWRLQVPPQAPIGAVDYRALAKLQLSGGHIRSVALNAAFLAAERGQAIGQDHFIAAARSEFAKLERTFTPPAGGVA